MTAEELPNRYRQYLDCVIELLRKCLKAGVDAADLGGLFSTLLWPNDRENYAVMLGASQQLETSIFPTWSTKKYKSNPG
jgi:hypothetical protein